MPSARDLFFAALQNGAQLGAKGVESAQEAKLKQLLQSNQQTFEQGQQEARLKGEGANEIAKVGAQRDAAIAEKDAERVRENKQLMELYGASDLATARKLAEAHGSSLKVGGVAVGADPFARLAGAAPKQAAGFLKTIQGTYKPINDQLDASQATLDALDQGNATSDKLALINEARLAAGTGGSRAIKSLVDTLSGGKTAGGDFQDALNYLNNTPNIPTLQPAQRDAVRESVFARLPQLGQSHKQAQAALTQQGAIVAPQTDAGGLINSVAGSAQARLDQLSDRAKKYSDLRRAQMAGGNPAISSKSQASPNPTTLDKLKSFFGGGQAAPQDAPQAPAPGGFDPDAYLGKKK